jgi:hypothetical protein
MFLIYRKARKDMQYFSALCAMTFLIYLHLFFLFGLLNLDKIIIPNKLGEKWKYYIPILILGLPILFFLRLTIKESDLKKLNYSVQKIRRGNTILIIDFVTTFILIFVIAILKKK